MSSHYIRYSVGKKIIYITVKYVIEKIVYIYKYVDE